MHEVTVTELCDFCREDLARKPTATRARKVTVDGKTFLVDACPKCTKTELSVLDTIVETSRPDAAPSTGKRKRRVPCPDCGGMFMPQGLETHRTRQHKGKR